MLKRSSVFLFTSIASIALGIGAVVAILTAAHQLLFEPLPFPEEDRLVFVSEVQPSGAATGVALQNMLDFRESGSFDAMAGYRRRTFGRRCCTARSKSLTSLCRLQSHPAQYVSGIPSAAILLSISHPIRCSTRCLANVRARISGPMIAL